VKNKGVLGKAAVGRLFWKALAAYYPAVAAAGAAATVTAAVGKLLASTEADMNFTRPAFPEDFALFGPTLLNALEAHLFCTSVGHRFHAIPVNTPDAYVCLACNTFNGKNGYPRAFCCAEHLDEHLAHGHRFSADSMDDTNAVYQRYRHSLGERRRTLVGF
jgi:hypothetical protein